MPAARYFVNFLVALLIFLCASCAKGGEREVVKAVEKYNKRLVEAYKMVDLDLMRDVATEDEMGRLLPVMQALLNEDSVMIASQKDFKVKTVSLTGNTANVETEEFWVYWWENPHTGATTKGKKQISYNVRYRLVKKEDRWLVSGLESTH
jgi:hypothetical protein